MFTVQFFTWLAFFALWIYATPFFAQAIFNSGNSEKDFEIGVRWASYAFAFYVTLGAIFSFFIEKLSRRVGKAKFHAFALLVGSLGLGSLFFIQEKYLTFISFIFIGLAWSSISVIPYNLVGKIAEREEKTNGTDEEAEEKTDLYYKIFGISAVLPQITAAFFWSYVSQNFFNGQPQYILFSGAISLLIASILMLFISLKYEFN